ncbi:MAG: hydrolase, partial [Raoultibacter sp.]
MDEHTHSISRRTLVGGAAAFTLASLATPSFAFAETTSDQKRAEADAVRIQIRDLQGKLNKASDDYYGAL